MEDTRPALAFIVDYFSIRNNFAVLSKVEKNDTYIDIKDYTENTMKINGKANKEKLSIGSKQLTNNKTDK